MLVACMLCSSGIVCSWGCLLFALFAQCFKNVGRARAQLLCCMYLVLITRQVRDAALYIFSATEKKAKCRKRKADMIQNKPWGCGIETPRAIGINAFMNSDGGGVVDWVIRFRALNTTLCWPSPISFVLIFTSHCLSRSGGT